VKAKPTQDLGFGTRVGTGPGERLLNRDGSFTVRRHGLPLRAIISLYHSLLVMRWPTFLALLALTYLLLNLSFAVAYLALGEGALAGPGESTLAGAFFFSVQTVSTIGYGHIVPMGLAANSLAAFEAFIGMLGVALVTGIVFARFSRPTADIVFSDRGVIAPYRGIKAFQFRIANRRRNQIIETRVRVFLSMVEQDGEAGPARRSFMELTLERNQLAFFPLSWTIVHPIDEASPLSGLTEQDVKASGAEFLVTMTGIDDSFSQVVHTRTSYTAEEIEWDTRFSNMYERTPLGTPRAMDVARIHDFEPAGPDDLV